MAADLSVARFAFDPDHPRAQLDGARILSRLMRQMDFGAAEDDGSVIVVFAETDLRTAHAIARRLSSVMRHTSHGKRDARSEPTVTVATLLPSDTRKVAAGAALRGSPPRGVVVEMSHAALRSSARLASWRRISVVPARRSSGVSHSWKNTTFMSGRTFAAWPCWRMK